MSNQGSRASEPGPDSAPAKLVGVGGWLGSFVVTCFAAPVVMVIGEIEGWRASPAEDFNALSSLVPLFGVIRGFDAAGVFVLGAALAVVGVCILQQRRFAALLAVVVLTELLVFLGCDILLTIRAAGRLNAALARAGVPSAEGGYEIEMVETIAGTLIWIRYFFRSRRVRVNFGPVTLRRVAAWVAGRGLERGGAP